MLNLKSMTRPLIGISGRRWPMATLGDAMPPAMDGLTFDLHISDYGSSVAAAGGLPVELSRDADVADIISRLDGLILTGGADLDPSHYGAQPDPKLGSVEVERDAWEFALYAQARQRKLPILGICRGFQLINVAEGGTLIQHVELDEGSGHPQWDVDGRSATHQVSCLSGSLIASLIGEEAAVNSLHHQVIGVLAQGLVAEASAPDGVLEAFVIPGSPVLAVQWHPELLGGPDPTFHWLVREASLFASSISPA